MRYFVVYYKYIVQTDRGYNYNVYCLKSEKYPSIMKLALQIKDSTAMINNCNKEDIVIGIYGIQELSEQDFKDFNS